MLWSLSIASLMVLSQGVEAAAQHSSAYIYGFVAPVVVPQSAFTAWDGTFVHIGGGGEGHLVGKLGLAGEIGVLKPVTNPYGMTTGLASVAPTIHFLAVTSQQKFDPFIDGGFSLLFGRGVATGLNYGGGMNYWLRSRLGLRVEFRHHLWSPEAGETVNFLGLRFGVVFKSS
jgi:hypothetical protein